MPSLNSKILKSQAADRLGLAGNEPRKMIWIHTGVTVLLSLLGSAISLYLDYQIGDTGGLSGLGTRSVLQTIQTFVQYATMIFTPFWSASFVLLSLHWATNRPTAPKDLLSGFQRFSSILSYQLLLILLFFLAAMVCGNIATVIFTMTPLSDSLLTILEPVVASGILDTTLLESLPMDQLLEAYLPMLVIYAAILLPVLVFLSYTLRLTTFFIMDDPQMSGLRAMSTSVRAMRGHKVQMLKLDLSFWWYYLLEAGLMVVCYLDVILPALGVTFPFDPTVAYFISLILYCVLEMVLHLWKKAEVETTYALAYQTIIHPND